MPFYIEFETTPLSHAAINRLTDTLNEAFRIVGGGMGGHDGEAWSAEARLDPDVDNEAERARVQAWLVSRPEVTVTRIVYRVS